MRGSLRPARESDGPAQASTIVDVTGDTPRVLRAGAIPLAALREVVPDLAELEED